MNHTPSSKALALRLFTSQPVSRFFHPLMHNRCTVFMLHRFRAPELNVFHGHDPETLRRTLELLRQRGYEFVSVDRLFDQAGNGPALRRAVAFTMDDGYQEQVAIAGPVFAAYDCPVTTFVTTGFLDGKLWFWWDQVSFVFEHTARSWIRLALPQTTLEWRWTTGAERERAQAQFTAWCKTVADEAKHAAIALLAAEAEVALPPAPPSGYAPMSWDDLRVCEGRGMSFGPHTVTHPILSRTSDAASHYELEESWRRLRVEARNPVAVFCYPNGGWGDFGEREVLTLRRLGLRGAVVGVPGFARRLGQREAMQAYAIRRMPFPDDTTRAVQYVCGLERLKMMVRRIDA